MRVQKKLGSDIAMAFDQCAPFPCSREDAEEAVRRTSLWAARSKEAHDSEWRGEDGQALFGIVQGSVFPDLRRRSAGEIVPLDFPGYAVGGLSVGEPAEEMYHILDVLKDLLPFGKPRYLMGVGRPDNLVEAVARGIDMFDCVLPTRNGRNGTLFSRGAINIKGKSTSGISPRGRGVRLLRLPNLHKGVYPAPVPVGEILASRLCGWHNLRFLIRLGEEMRLAILGGGFPDSGRTSWCAWKGPERMTHSRVVPVDPWNPEAR